MIYYNYQIYHFLYIILFLSLLTILFIGKKKISWDKYKKILFLVASISAVLNIFDFTFYLLFGNLSSLLNSLPFYLCDMNSIIILIVILLDKEWLNHYLRWCIIPFTSLALIFPDILDGMYHAYDYQILTFYLTHSITIAVGIILAPEYKVNKFKSSLVSFGFLLILTLISYVVTLIDLGLDFKLNYAYLKYPPNYMMSLVYNIIPVPVVYMVVIYCAFYLIYFGIYKLIENKKHGGSIMKKKIVFEYILSGLSLAGVIITSALMYNMSKNSSNPAENEIYQEKMEYSFELTNDLRLNEYDLKKLEIVKRPCINFQADVQYISSAANSSVFYKVIDHSYELGHYFYAGDYVGKDTDGVDIYAEKDMVILNITSEGFTCFFGYETLMYSYVPIKDLEYIQKAKYKGVISNKGDFYDVSIDRIDTTNIYKNCVYVEYSLNTFDDTSYYGYSRFVGFDEYEEKVGIKKSDIRARWEVDNITACYVVIDNKITEIYLKIGGEDELYYIFTSAIKYDEKYNQYIIDLKSINEVYFYYK